MRTRRRNLKQRMTATVNFAPADLETVDDAAEALEQTRSLFIGKAAVEKARRVVAQKARRAEAAA